MSLDLVTDPAFLLAVFAWVLLLIPTWCLCVAAARGDRMAERSRQDVQERAGDRESAVLERRAGGFLK